MDVHLHGIPRAIALEKRDGVPVLVLLDQRALPYEQHWIETSDWRTVIDAVKTLAVRGAPAIGIAGAAALMLRAWEFLAAGGDKAHGRPFDGAAAAKDVADISAKATDCLMCRRNAASLEEGAACPLGDSQSCEAAMDGHRTFVLDERDFDKGLYKTSLEFSAGLIERARPTAVNLSWAVKRTLARAEELLDGGAGPREIAEDLFGFVEGLLIEDEACNRSIGANGASVLPDNARILTHCNAGSLATAFYGTALGVVYAAAAGRGIERVYADETRPLGQGARLTVWELSRAGIPVTLLCDDMAASVLSAGLIDAVVVGADRIAANGDAANKIGTLGVAVMAAHYGVPFYVAAPTSTIDAAIADGSAIVIEERACDEVLPRPLDGVDVINPAFDVTPADLIAAIITEKGVFEPALIADALRGDGE